MATSVSASQQYFQGGKRAFPSGYSTQTITFLRPFNQTPTLISVTPLETGTDAGFLIQGVTATQMVVQVSRAVSGSYFYWMAGVSL